LALAVPAALALFTGWLSFYRGASPFFATVISLVVPIVVSQLLLSGGKWTGSSSGLTGFETFEWTMDVWFWVAGSALLLTGVVAWIVAHSDAGRVLVSIRDNEARCAYLGIRVSRTRIIALVATAAVAGLAGYGYGTFNGVVAPELSGFALGTELIIWVALGGRGTIWGPLFGAVAINVATAYLSSSMPFAWQLIVGSAFVLVIIVLPRGLIPFLFAPLRLEAIGRSIPRIVGHDVPQTGDRNDSALVMDGVAKHFGSLEVLRKIKLRAGKGELIGLIGPNGAGKTTLMRCISNGEERSLGRVVLCGHDIDRHPPEKCVEFGLGRKFQNASIFETLTVAECLRLATTRFERPKLTQRSDVLNLPAYAVEVIRATELDQKLGLIAGDLSHGQQQALELAMVLALAPQVVLLDEPTAGLSQAERRSIGRVLSDLALKHRLCCLLVEHDLDFVQDVATRIVVLHLGEIVMDGTYEEVVNSELVRTIYAGNAIATENAA